MEVLKFNLNIPYWCSFADFSSLKIKMSYPFPPTTTLYGMILNAMDKPAIHTIYPMKFSDKNVDNNQKKLKNKLEQLYLKLFDNIQFSIVIKSKGEKIEDYSNIHKINRIDNIESKNIKPIVSEYNTNFHDDYIKNNLKEIIKYDFYLEFINFNQKSENYEDIIVYLRDNHPELLDIIKKEWELRYKIFMSTQIKKQKLMHPEYTIYLHSVDNNISLEKIMNCLKKPNNPLYLGESDDLVDITNINIVTLDKIKSNEINSIIPGIYPNSELVKVPNKLKFDKNDNHQIIISIPNNELDEEISCYTDGVNNIVFI